MEALDIPRGYRTIMVPSSFSQLITNLNAATQAMRRFFQHLEPGGIVVMPFMILWQGPITDQTVAEDWELIAEQARPEDGVLIRRWTRSTYHLPQQLEDTEDRYEVVREGEIVASELYTRSPATRWYTQEQAMHLYEETGFTNIRMLSEFSQVPASQEDTIFSILGVRSTH